MGFNELLKTLFSYLFGKCFVELLGLLQVGFTIEDTADDFPEEILNKFLVLGLLRDKQWFEHEGVS